jgi:hypothetical protein
MRPLVFVAMPFGRKLDPLRRYEIDFDDVYRRAILPAIGRFDVDAVRADEERGGGIVHLPMYERLLLAEIAVVDITIANPNVYYELGIRHAARPRSTIVVGSFDGPIPFDLALVRAVPYTLVDGQLSDAAATAFVEALALKIGHALEDLDARDSPLFQLLPALVAHTLPHDVTESFRDRARDIDAIRLRLDDARGLFREGKASKDSAAMERSRDAVRADERALGAISQATAESFFDVFLAFRDLEAYDDMIRAADAAPAWLLTSMPVLREQFALALNRTKVPENRRRATQVLEKLIAERGDNPETSSLLGRVWKDQYVEALAAGEASRARTFLARATDAYRRGFHADPRDFYPGINLATLLALCGDEDAVAELRQVGPAVTFAVARLGGLGSKDYWLVATMLELAVLASDESASRKALARISTLRCEPWMRESTANNLSMLRRDVPAGVLDADLIDAAITELREPV